MIPVGGPVGSYVTVVSVELYADAICIRWLDDRGHDEKPGRPSIADNLGTAYGEDGFTVGSGNGGLHGEAWFSPGVPRGAVRVEVAADEATLEVAL